MEPEGIEPIFVIELADMQKRVEKAKEDELRLSLALAVAVISEAIDKCECVDGLLEHEDFLRNNLVRQCDQCDELRTAFADIAALLPRA